ncbi:uncharacterized protein LOC121054441 [Oryza brachyantha]|uniref:uncharacterized protein LOC121054441 n=1 Tax=Oryza brachyantha TaxID=4533 RepID=UPI001ADCCA8A|nr:uncharacterized protein LOC121054441 [Oryza brachyantha]
MGTEVLRPHDCLDRVRAHAHATKRSPRQQTARRRDVRGPQGGQAVAAPAVTRVVRVKVAAAEDDAYAGPAFGAMSPSPRALPLPRFSSCREAATAASAAAAAGVDDSATRELRRLLGLH